LGFQDLGVGVHVLGFGVKFWVWGLGCMVQGL
jgi:hypothetical protein